MMRSLHGTARLVSALLLTTFAPAVLLAAQLSQPSPLAGRWVNTDLQVSSMMVLYFQPAGKVLNLMPMPQFGATYELEGKRLQLTSTAGPLGPERTPLVLTLDGNILRKDSQPLLGRLGGDVPTAPGVGGTWRLLAKASMEEFWTFRSDGEVMLEVGIAGTYSSKDGTLKLSTRSFTLRRDGDDLYVEGQGKNYRFVRRPWGCFGLPDEASVSECRHP